MIHRSPLPARCRPRSHRRDNGSARVQTAARVQTVTQNDIREGNTSVFDLVFCMSKISKTLSDPPPLSKSFSVTSITFGQTRHVLEGTGPSTGIDLHSLDGTPQTARQCTTAIRKLPLFHAINRADKACHVDGLMTKMQPMHPGRMRHGFADLVHETARHLQDPMHCTWHVLNHNCFFFGSMETNDIHFASSVRSDGFFVALIAITI